MPAISVVLPTHNRRALLGRAIASVLDQRFSDLELIVVDDASEDDSCALVESIDDPRLRLLRLPENRGAAEARNAGVRAARADWIAFQDSDDEWLPDKLSMQWTVVEENPGLDWVIGAYDAITPGGRIRISPAAILAGRPALTDVLDGWPIITPTWLARKSSLLALGGFRGQYSPLEDWDLAFRLTASGTTGAVAEPMLIKHEGPGALCANPALLARALSRVLETHADAWRGEPVRLARRLAHLGCLRFWSGERRGAHELLRRSVAQAPTHGGPWALWLASLLGARALRAAERRWPQFAGMSP